MPNGAIIVPTGVVKPVAVAPSTRTLISEEVINFDDVTVKSLNVPATANLAEIWVKGGNIMHRLLFAPTTAIHIIAQENSAIELESVQEAAAFRFVGQSANVGKLIVYYFNYSSNNI